MFNFCAISAIVTLLSPENNGSGFFHFVITGWCWEASCEHCVIFPEHFCPFINTPLRKRTVPTLSTYKCEFQRHAQHTCIITYRASPFFLGEQCTRCSHVQCPVQTHTWAVRSRLSVCWLVTQPAIVLPTLESVTHISDHKENCGNFLRILEDPSCFQHDVK
jgi:hypothetical protein